MKTLKKVKSFTNAETDRLKTKEEGIVAEIESLKVQLVDIRQAYHRAKNPNLKEGGIYSYSRSDSSKNIIGQLFMDTAEMNNIVYLNCPYKLRILKKDGTIGSMVRVVYDPERLKYVKD